MLTLLVTLTAIVAAPPDVPADGSRPCKSPPAVAAPAKPEAEPFVAFGRVTDEAGRPLEGVTVHAAAGWGSLRPTGTATTDADGRYRLPFGPGVLLGDFEAPRGVGTQVATIGPRKDGWYEVGLGRAGNLRMSDLATPPTGKPFDGYAGVVRAGTPHEVNFTLAPGGVVAGRFVDEFGGPIAGQTLRLDGDELPPSQGVLATATTDAKGYFRFEGVPVRLAGREGPLAWRLTFRPFVVRHELTTAEFTVAGPSAPDGPAPTHELTLRSEPDETGIRMILDHSVAPPP